MMKKTLVAVAASAVAGAFAQVTITGNVDVGFRSISSQAKVSDLNQIAAGGMSTTALSLKGTEDLGGGLKAGFSMETTFGIVDTSLSNDAAPSTAGATQAYTGAFFNSEAFVSVAGGFGEVRAGVPNAALNQTQGVTQPFGTALGSGYSSSFSRMGGSSSSSSHNHKYSLNNGVGGAQGGGGSIRVLRMPNTIQYYTPTMGGLRGMVEYSVGNDNATGTAAVANNSPTFMGLMVAYTQGNLNLGFALNTIKTGSNAIFTNGLITATSSTIGATGSTPTITISTVQTAAIAANTDVSYQVFGGNYKMGANTFYAGLTTLRSSAGDEDSQSWNLAYKYDLSPKTSLIANKVSRSSALAISSAATSNNNASLIGLGVNHSLSKRTTLYARYESVDVNTDNNATGETNTTFVGIRHQF
jgi:predicted porin